ncbi:MAG TPA: ATP-binding cassette domain-containing protein [Gaiellaceae bacterium]|jgi:zinc transport system ATP-binding protein|nr:ATP-binding cassette domain-containing protein [Gaiellaceae bacterium]
MSLAIRLAGVSFGYDPRRTVLSDVNVEIPEGQFVAVAGPNGGGKTTLLRLIVGLSRPQTGTVRVFGEPVGAAARRGLVGYLPQRAHLGIEAPATVREIVSAGRVTRRHLFGPLSADDRRTVDAAIARVGLDRQAGQPVNTLSGGQQQRAFIAKAIAAEPRLLILDEPTSGVDADAQDALAGLLARLHGELRVTVLYVSHEFGAIEHVAERLLLVRGGIEFDGSPAELPERWHDPSHSHA